MAETGFHTTPDKIEGLLSTVDDVLRFGRLLLAGGENLLSPESVQKMTTNHPTPRQIDTGGILLDPKGWGYGMGVAPDGRYGWDGGYGTVWFNDPKSDIVAVAFSQCSGFLFNDGRVEFMSLI